MKLICKKNSFVKLYIYCSLTSLDVERMDVFGKFSSLKTISDCHRQNFTFCNLEKCIFIYIETKMMLNKGKYLNSLLIIYCIFYLMCYFVVEVHVFL